MQAQADYTEVVFWQNEIIRKSRPAFIGISILLLLIFIILAIAGIILHANLPPNRESFVFMSITIPKYIVSLLYTLSGITAFFSAVGFLGFLGKLLQPSKYRYVQSFINIVDQLHLEEAIKAKILAAGNEKLGLMINTHNSAESAKVLYEACVNIAKTMREKTIKCEVV